MICGRKSRSPRILNVRPITKDDMLLLHKPASRVLLARLRDSHHMVARLAASGISNGEIAEATGYSYSRIAILLQDPSMRELIARYRGKITDAWLDGETTYLNTVRANRNKAERMISDKLDAADETDTPLPTRELLAISRDAADRTGFGKVQKNLNINVDFAAKLEAARQRSATVEGYTFETRVSKRI